MNRPSAGASSLLAIACLALVAANCGPETTSLRADAPSAADDDRPIRLRIAGFLDGHLEPCGCAKAQHGGLARRIFNLKRDRDYDLLIEGGNLVHDATELASYKLLTTFEVMGMIPPHAIAIGPADLELGERLFEQLENFRDYPFVSSDLKPKSGTTWPAKGHVEHTIEGGRKVRVAALALRRPDAVAAKLELLEPAAAWSRALAGADAATYRVVALHGKVQSIKKLADTLQPRPDLVIGITAEIPDAPGVEDATEGGVPVVYPGTKGRMMLDVIVRRTDTGPRVTKYGVIRLKGSETAKGAYEDRGAKAAIEGHRYMVAESGALENMADQLPTPNGWTYVGSEACVDCHEEAVEVWNKTAHARAWETLEKAEADPERYGWPVTKYPDCVECHVVGYRYKSGFVNPERTPKLKNVDCESCHGPGSEHIEEQTVETIDRGNAETCIRCHDREQTPDFDYLKLWAKIKH